MWKSIDIQHVLQSGGKFQVDNIIDPPFTLIFK